MDTVGKNIKKIEEYIKSQLQEDMVADQIGIKELIDPFTGEPVEKPKKNSCFSSWREISAIGGRLMDPQGTAGKKTISFGKSFHGKIP